MHLFDDARWVAYEGFRAMCFIVRIEATVKGELRWQCSLLPCCAPMVSHHVYGIEKFLLGVNADFAVDVGDVGLRSAFTDKQFVGDVLRICGLSPRTRAFPIRVGTACNASRLFADAFDAPVRRFMHLNKCERLETSCVQLVVEGK